MHDMRAVYEEMILDHNRNPRNFLRKPPGSTHHSYGFNPLCGDEFSVYLAVEDGVIADVGFDGAGCAISTASASLMTEAIKGKTLKEAEALFADVRGLLTGEGAAGDVGKLAVLAGVRDYPMRVKCATLAWHMLLAALENKPETVCTEGPNPTCELPAGA
jgi:nitrogen fixation NifU-like protein